MHIAIFKIENKKIYVDLDYKTNKIIGYSYFNDQKYQLKINEVLCLIYELFDKKSLQFIKKENEYEIYINKDTDYYHFYKDGQEDYYKFFFENGQLAMLYSTDDSLKGKHHPKFFRNKKTKNSFMTTIYIAVLLSLFPPVIVEHFNIIKNDVQSMQEAYTLKREYGNPEIFSESLILSEYLSSSDKELLDNSELFEDICKIKVDYSRAKSLEEKLDNIKIEGYTTNEKQENDKKAEEKGFIIMGFYEASFPNLLKVLEPESDDDTKVHEFIHLLEENYEYSYLVEACTEIIKTEYYKNKIDNYGCSYTEEQKRARVLMEIIGSDVIWNMLYGDVEPFENVIDSLLSPEESEEFLNLMSISPSSLKEREREKNHKKIDLLLSIMYQNKYNEPIENNELIALIYNKNDIFILENNRRYFKNDNKQENQSDFVIYDDRSIEELESEGKIKVDVYIHTESRISFEEYKKHQHDNNEKVKYKERTILKNVENWEVIYDAEGAKYYTNMETGEKYSLEDLIKMGETLPLYFKEQRTFISLKELTKIINQKKYDKSEGFDNFQFAMDYPNLVIDVENSQTNEICPVKIQKTENGYEYTTRFEEELNFPPVLKQNTSKYSNSMI